MMKNKSTGLPLVSVLMCTYNDDAYIGEAIESILNQSYSNLEFIIVNDGSTDKTKDIILSYTTAKIRYLENVENQGQEVSKNKGIAQAKGKYIAYMDGDDISKPERIAIQVEFMETHHDIGFCCTGLTFIGNRSGDLLPYDTDERIRLHSLISTPMPHATCMIRREIIEANNIGYEEGFEASEDYLFILRLLEKTKAYGIQKSLYNYRWHENNISINKGGLQNSNFRKISRMAFKNVLNIDLLREEHAAIFPIFIRSATVEQITIAHPILVQKLSDSNAKLVKPFRKLYSERLIRAYNFESPRGFITLVSFFKTRPWRQLSFIENYQKYFLITAKCIYRNFVKQKELQSE